jgi:hypothetical protein
MEQEQMHKWYLESGESNIRTWLRGWRPWILFLRWKGTNSTVLVLHPRPQILFWEFLTNLNRLDVAHHVRITAVPAAQALFDILRRDFKLSDHSQARSLRRTISIAIKKPHSDMTIWPFEVFTQYVRECRPPEKQGWPDLMGLATAVFVTMVPSRPIAPIRIEPTRAKTRNDGQALTIPN